MTIIKVKTKNGYKFIRANKVVNRYEVIRSYVIGQDVLDLGCVDHSFERASSEKGEFWLHRFLCEVSKSCLGVDILEEEIKKAKKLGYNCVVADVENLNLDKKFDVVIAGELIEHLHNPGQFLEIVKKHLILDGALILTTTNPFYLYRFFKIITNDNIPVNEEHTCFFDPKTLSYLLMQHGFDIKEIYWYVPSATRTRLFYLLEKATAAFRRYFSPRFMIVATLDEKEVNS